MEERWDIYDKNKQLTGRTMKRNDWTLKDDEYHLTVLGVIRRSDGKFLITKRVMTKAWAPGWWEVSGGAAQAGEASYDAVLREVKEETGLDVKDAEGLKAKVKEQIKTRKEAEIEDKYIDDCLKLAVSKMTVEINPEIIDEEIHRIIDQVSQQLKMNGLTLEQYMQFTGMTHEDLHKQYEETATNRVKERFLLEEVAKEEKIEISDKDADAKAEEMAKNYGMTKEDLLKEFGGLDMVKYDMKMREAINIVKGE